MTTIQFVALLGFVAIIGPLILLVVCAIKKKSWRPALKWALFGAVFAPAFLAFWVVFQDRGTMFLFDVVEINWSFWSFSQLTPLWVYLGSVTVVVLCVRWRFGRVRAFSFALSSLVNLPFWWMLTIFLIALGSRPAVSY